MSARRFAMLLGAILLLALTVRLVYIFTTTWNDGVVGDQFNYHYTANGLAGGHGFQTWILKVWAVPEAHLEHHATMGGLVAVERSASYSPLYQVYLAAFSLVGLDSIHAHLIATLLIGLALVAAVGVLGREVAGPRVGLIAAAIAAVYANFWINDGVIMSEALGMLLAAAMVFLAYRLWRAPSRRGALIFGVLGGLGALARSELALLLVMLTGLFVVRALAGRPIKERLGQLGMILGVALLVVSPWLIRNMTIFEKPVFLTSEPGVTLAGTNCDGAYYGPLTGWWDGRCIVNHETYPKGDPSERNAVWQRRAFDYIGHHSGRFSVVVATRVGRMWGVFHPGSPWGDLGEGQTLALDVLEGRPEGAARTALAQFYVLALLAIGGAVLLAKQRKLIAPLVALIVLVLVVGAATFGTARYRAVGEIAIAIFAAAAVDGIVSKIKHRSAVPSTTGGSNGG